MEDLENITDEYDKEFISLMITIEKKSEQLNKYDKLRIKNWCKKLCQVTNNIEWKKNRNLHAICILDSILNEHFEEPYNKFPPEGSVPILNKALVKSKLSKKFFEETLNIRRNEEQLEQQQNMENINEHNEEYEEENDNNLNANYNNNLNHKKMNNKSNTNNNYPNVNNQNMKIINEQKNEINRLNMLLRQKDIDIDTLIKEKIQMQSHIEELEQMIDKFMEIAKSNE